MAPSRPSFPARQSCASQGHRRRNGVATTGSRPSSATRSSLTVEPLERRALLAVTAVINGGDLEIAYNVAGDLAADIASDGTNYTVSGTGLAATQFPIGAGGVTARIVVTDKAGLTGQTFTVNAGTPLTNPLQVNAAVEATTLTGGITTTVAGDVLIGSPAISLANDISTAATNSKVTLSGAVTLAASVAVRAGFGVVTLSGTADGGHGLVLDSKNTINLAQDIGTTTRLASLETPGSGVTNISATAVRTSGGQIYRGRVWLPLGTPPRTTVLEGPAVRILAGLVGQNNSLTIDGNAELGGQAEAITDVTGAVLTITGASVIDWVGMRLNTAIFVGDVVFQSPRETIVNATSLVHFRSAVIGPDAILSVGAGGDVVFDGPLGTSTEPLAALTVSTLRIAHDGGDIRVNAAMHADTMALLADGVLDGGPDHSLHAPDGISLVGVNGIGGTTPITFESARGVSATANSGSIRLRSIGNLVVAGDEDRGGGLVAAGTIDLQASGDIIVPRGLRILGAEGVTANQPIRWQVNRSEGTRPGTLGNVINNANVAAVPGIVEFVALSSVYPLFESLPEITTSLVIDGGGTVAIAGRGVEANGFAFAEGSAGSVLQNISLRGFRNFGIRLENSPGVTISNVTVTSMNTRTSMGLYATGNLAGTTVESSRFTGGLRGALLVNARNLAFGAIGRGNTFFNNRPVPGSQYSGTGIRAQGNLTGTVVAGNTFNWNNYGFAFINARNLRLENNLFTRNRIAAIFVEGNNTGSSMSGNTFGQGAQRNASIFRRIPGARGI